MKKIVFYISGFGFGHLTRSIALLQELLRQGPDLHITVRVPFTAYGAGVGIV